MPLGAVRPALGQGGPDRGGVGQERLQGGLTGPHDPGPPALARLAGRGRIMEDRIQAQPGQEGDGWFQALAGGQQLQGGVGAVPDDHQLPVGEPATQKAQHLARPVRDRLVAAAAGLVVALGRGPHGQEGQGPHPVGPGDLDQQHQADPAQSLGLDEVAVGGAHRVPVHPQGLDLLPPAPFQGLVDGQPQRSRRNQVLDQLAQQYPADGQGRPGGAAEDMVEQGEVAPRVEAQHIQGRGHRAPTGGQNDPRQQDLHLAPGACIEQRREGRQQRYNRGGQAGHDEPFVVIWSIVPACFACPNPTSSCTKSS